MSQCCVCFCLVLFVDQDRESKEFSRTELQRMEENAVSEKVHSRQ